MSRSLRAMRQKAEMWLRQGISPQRLALTLALGFAIGCIPVIGVPTAVCLVVALGLRLEYASNPGCQLRRDALPNRLDLPVRASRGMAVFFHCAQHN